MLQKVYAKDQWLRNIKYMSIEGDLQLFDACFKYYSTFALGLITIRQSYLQQICCSMLHHLMAWYLAYQLPADECLHSTRDF